MEQVAQKYVRRKVADLTPHPRNPRQGDVGAIHQSIEANGFYGALVVQKSTGYVLAGNHRLQAAIHAGATSVPVLEVDVNDATATRILLADNRTNDLAATDDVLLSEILTALAKAGDLEGTGYDPDDVDALLLSLEPPNLDALASEYGAPTAEDTHLTIRVTVPPEVMAAWKAHVDTHMGDEQQAMAALLEVPV